MVEKERIGREKLAISGVFLSQEDSKVLLLRRSPHRTHSPSQWDLMGGDIKQGETPREILKRDAKGKLGITISSVEEKGTVLTEGTDAPVRRHVFICKGVYGGFTLDPTKYDQFCWFGKGEIDGLDLTPGVKSVLEAIGFLS
jgi:8-oxo-dGTP pyrophosphatase MutT (NUDIX family)